VVTEVCVQYVEAARFRVGDRELSMREWLRFEWQRTGLPFRLANEACGVANAATRKYLTADHLGYDPPVEAFVSLAEYANRHGKPEGRPYFSSDGKRPIPGAEWAKMGAEFRCEVGVTNVWREPQLGGFERMQGDRNHPTPPRIANSATGSEKGRGSLTPGGACRYYGGASGRRVRLRWRARFARRHRGPVAKQFGLRPVDMQPAGSEQ